MLVFAEMQLLYLVFWDMTFCHWVVHCYNPEEQKVEAGDPSSSVVDLASDGNV
jgi:hypothetical protein